ncbi:MAG: class I SAM-dependent methyltransferase [Opitutae bacterium]|nr:class I SAM-dependent methyltransferase [Opitutae bacterium]
MLGDVAAYYSAKLKMHGDTPSGVDWNSKESQVLRFQQLGKIISPQKKRFSLADLGCGYGALYEYLVQTYNFSYLGVDICKSMIQVAENRHQGKFGVRFVFAPEPDMQCDYCVASGIFNVRLDNSDDDWFDYLSDTLRALDKFSLKGFAFNCLSSYSDEDKRRDDLYYADPRDLFDHCKRRFSRNVTLLHDYGLYEFTILVRKQL